MNTNKGLPQNIHVFGTGFVGTAICNLLSKSKNFNVIRYPRNLLDLQKFQDNKKSFEILDDDSVVFAAAKVPVRTVSDLVYNLEIVENFIKLCERYSFRYLLNISSDSLYPNCNDPINEFTLPSPASLHGQMHLIRETLLRSKLSVEMAHLRPTLIYGAADPHESYGPNQFIKKALRNETIHIYGRGEESRDFIFIEDIAKIAINMLQNKTSGIVNAATGMEHTFFEISSLIKESIPTANFEFVTRPENQTVVLHRVFDIRQLRKQNLLDTPVNIDKGINKMITELREVNA